MTDWRWEYEPNAQHVIGGIDDLGFIARVEERADELVRTAVVVYLESTAYEGTSPHDSVRKSSKAACSSTRSCPDTNASTFSKSPSSDALPNGHSLSAAPCSVSPLEFDSSGDTG